MRGAPPADGRGRVGTLRSSCGLYGGLIAARFQGVHNAAEAPLRGAARVAKAPLHDRRSAAAAEAAAAESSARPTKRKSVDNAKINALLARGRAESHVQRTGAFDGAAAHKRPGEGETLICTNRF